MTILDRIDAAHKQARKDTKSDVASFLSYLLAEARRVGKDTDNRVSTDDEVIGVIRKIIARNEENLRLTNGADTSVGWQNKILNEFLPTQMNEQDLETAIKAIITLSGSPKEPKLIGRIMMELKATHFGQYSPQMASQIAKKLLQE